MVRLKKVEARAGYRLYVEFADGLSGEVDLSDQLFGPVFLPLKDEALFQQVTLDQFGAPTWPNGADLAADGLYELLRARRDAASPSP